MKYLYAFNFLVTGVTSVVQFLHHFGHVEATIWWLLGTYSFQQLSARIEAILEVEELQ